MKIALSVVMAGGIVYSSLSYASAPGWPDKIRIGFQKGGSLVLLKSSGELEKSLAAKKVSVEWKEFAFGPPMVEALNAGSVDIGFVGSPPPVFAQAGAAPDLVYVGYGQPTGKGYGIVVKDTSPVKDFTQLKGKRIGVAKGSAGEYFLLQALEKHHIPLSQIKESYLGYSEARAAWEQGYIDAWVVPDPRLADAEINSNARIVLTAADVDPQYNFYISPASFAHQYPQAAVAVLAAINTIEKQIEKNPDRAAILLAKDTRLTEAVWQKSLRRQSWGVGWPLSEKVIANQQQVAELFYRYHMIPAKVNVREIVASLPASATPAQ